MGINSPEIKAIESLAGFKESIKKRKSNDCLCRLCKVFISNVGFISNQSISDSRITKLFKTGGGECCKELLTGRFSGVGS